MNISLRATVPQDKEFCRSVHSLAFRDVVVRQFGGWDQERQDFFFEREWSNLKVQIVNMEGEEVGYFGRQVQEDCISITEIALLPKFQDKGIGTQLLVQQFDEGNRLGLSLRLEVLKENRARNLYERLGFRITGKTETHYLMERQPGSQTART